MTERFEDKVKKALGHRLTKAREAASFESAADFARALGIEEARYRSWEAGRHAPPVPLLVRICKLLKIEPNDLLPAATRAHKDDDAQSPPRAAAR